VPLLSQIGRERFNPKRYSIGMIEKDMYANRGERGIMVMLKKGIKIGIGFENK